MNLLQSLSRFSPILKAFLIFVISMLLLIPISMIDGIIYERKQLKSQSVKELASTWGGGQIIHAPMLRFRYYNMEDVQYTDSDNSIKHRRDRVAKEIFLAPLASINNFMIAPQVRSRGLYEVNLYSADYSSGGSYGNIYNRLREEGMSDGEIGRIYSAEMMVGLSHLNALESITASFIGKSVEFEISETAAVSLSHGGYERGYMAFSSDSKSGIYGKMPTVFAELPMLISSDSPGTESNKNKLSAASTGFQLELALRGTEMLAFIPIGKENKVKMEGEWGSPKFAGGFASSRNEVEDGSFSVEWDILSMNLNYPDAWSSMQDIDEGAAVGMELYSPIDNYRKTERAIKYAILIIMLVFAMYYFTEMKDHYSIHPIHYVLVGISISVFYLLLLSFSEIIGFGPSYIIASLMVIALLTLYTRSISPSTMLYKLVAMLQAFIFGFVYILLSLESYSLVAGSVGVFVILAVLMFYASKIDWYNKGGVDKDDPENHQGISGNSNETEIEV